MVSTENIEVFARNIGHGGTRAAIALSKAIHGQNWKRKVLYDHEVSQVDAGRAARRIHSMISTYPVLADLYSTGLVFNLSRRFQGASLREWAWKVAETGNPVVLCHESLVHALNEVGSTQPKFLATLNYTLKPGERTADGLDGIIVRSNAVKRQLINEGYAPPRIHVASIVDPDILQGLEEDHKRRTDRLAYCSGLKREDDLKGLIDVQYAGRLTVGVMTSGSGHTPSVIRRMIRSFKDPLSRNLINLVLVGCQYENSSSPMNVAMQEAHSLGLQVEIKKRHCSFTKGIQIIYDEDTKSLADSSVHVIRNVDAMVLTSATDVVAYTEAAACPSYLGGYRGLHEKSNWLHAHREGHRFTFMMGSPDYLWERIFRNLTGKLIGQHGTRSSHTLSGILYDNRASLIEPNAQILPFMRKILEARN
jgi:hypothetical protein